MQIIPAIDIIGGKCVRLTKGDYAQSKTYSDSPLEVAKLFEDNGIKRLHLVDLDGAKAAWPQNLKVLESIAAKTGLKVDFGGGIKSRAALVSVLDAGATWAGCSSIAVTSPEEFRSWCWDFEGHIILGADIKNGYVATHGWLKETALTVSDLFDANPMVGTSICTDISRDGMLSGIDTAFYKDLQAKYRSIDIIASGGVAGIGDVRNAFDAGLRGIIIGKAFYEGRITLDELKPFIC